MVGDVGAVLEAKIDVCDLRPLAQNSFLPKTSGVGLSPNWRCYMVEPVCSQMPQHVAKALTNGMVMQTFLLMRCVQSKSGLDAFHPKPPASENSSEKADLYMPKMNISIEKRFDYAQTLFCFHPFSTVAAEVQSEPLSVSHVHTQVISSSIECSNWQPCTHAAAAVHTKSKWQAVVLRCSSWARCAARRDFTLKLSTRMIGKSQFKDSQALHI